ncbi:MAG TPA: tetratricopeptide repeat protein [Bacteroidota bacterium]|nr:tetratricopeptide repeat protein [Bacteroidota bacterium]
MIPRMVCTTCGNEVLPSDKFCSSCGAKIEWGPGGAEPAPKLEKPAAADRLKPRVCSLCGHENPWDAATCASCGATLGSRQAAPKSSSGKPSAGKPAGAPLKFFQSGKFTALVAIVFIGLIIVFATTNRNRTEGPQQSPAQGPTSVIGSTQPDQLDPNLRHELDELEKKAETSPKDTATLLRLANTLYDARLFPRAVTMYKAYLAFSPANANARVDMGIAYFNMSFTDSLRRAEYLDTARKTIETALKYSPRHQLATFNLGVISLHTGDNETAIDWFRRCIAIDSTTEVAKRAQQFLSQH